MERQHPALAWVLAEGGSSEVYIVKHTDFVGCQTRS